MRKLPNKLQSKLDRRKREGALRSMPHSMATIDFASNDYLGLARNREVSHGTMEILEGDGPWNGSTGSRLLTGNHPLYRMVEEHLGSWHRAEAALMFNSGYDANLGFFASVPQRGDLVLYDELIHASIRDGIQMGRAQAYKYAHDRLQDLEQQWERLAKGKEGAEVYVVTESLYSMDGDIPDLVALAHFCKEKGCHLVVDEAHATGIFGRGRDLVCELGLEGSVFARIITFGKAIGCHGAAILGGPPLKEYLINFARSLIYTTALSPHTLAGILSAYRHLRQNGGELQGRLFGNIGRFRAEIEALGLSDIFVPSGSAIQSALVPGNERAREVALKLQEAGFDVRPILSPTVPMGKERLRFCLHAHNKDEEISRILGLLKQWVHK